MLPKPFSSIVVSKMLSKLNEAEVSPEDALEEIAALDPESALGRAMSDVMVILTNRRLFDFYQGYDREENTVKLYISASAPKEALKALLTSLEAEIETPDVNPEEKAPIITAKLYRKTTSEDSDWTLEVTVTADEYDPNNPDVPVQANISGDVDVQDKEEKEQQIVPEPSEDEI